MFFTEVTEFFLLIGSDIMLSGVTFLGRERLFFFFFGGTPGLRGVRILCILSAKLSSDFTSGVMLVDRRSGDLRWESSPEPCTWRTFTGLTIISRSSFLFWKLLLPARFYSKNLLTFLMSLGLFLAKVSVFPDLSLALSSA